MGNATDEQTILTAAEVANYSVCPEAWRLKIGSGSRVVPSERTFQARQLRKEWAEKQDLLRTLRRYARVSYLLLFALAAVAFVFEKRWALIERRISAAGVAEAGGKIPDEITALLLILGLVIFIWDLLERRSRRLRQTSGLSETATPVSVQGSSSLPAREYHSTTLGVTSKPAAVVREEGRAIPLDIYPLARKVRDRHIVPLLVHMRSMSESDGHTPPYGVLLMGPNQRRVKVMNNPAKQRWLEVLVDEMRSILAGAPAAPAPVLQKCRSCDVRDRCAYSAWRPAIAD